MTAFVSNGCNTTKIKDLQIPAGTSEINSMIDVGRQFDKSESRIEGFLFTEGYRNFDNIIRLLQPTANALEIFAFYDEQLKKIGFAKEQNAPFDEKNTAIAMWKKRGIFNEQVVLVAVIESRHKDTNELTAKTLYVISGSK